MNYLHKFIIILILLIQPLTAEDTTANLDTNLLTKKEQKFIKKHPIIRFRVRPDLPPFEFSQKGIPSGIAVDYIKKSAQNIGLNIEFIINDDPLDVTHKKIQNQNGEYDTILFSVKNKERAKKSSFGIAYLSYPMMIISHNNAPNITSLKDLKNKTIVLEQGFLTNKWVKRDYPSIKIINVSNTKKALQMVNDEKAIAYIGNLGVTTYMQIFSGMDNLKVSAHSGYGDINYSFIAPKQWPELSSLLSKGFKEISSVEHSFIQQKWFSIQTIEKTDYTLLWKLSLGLISIILWIFWWNRKLTLEKDRTSKALIELQETQDKFNRYFELSLNLQLISTTDGIITELNSASKSMLGYEKDELIGNQFLDLTHPDDVEPTIEEMSKLVRGENVYNFENRYIHKDGHYVNLLWTSTTDTSNNLIYATAQDITRLRKVEIDNKAKEQILFQQTKLASMGEMIGNIAHQWRQPLSVISTGATGMKTQKEYGLLSDEIFMETCDAINNNAQYLSKTIEDFKNFIKGERTKKVFNLTDNINSFLHLVEGTIRTHDIKIIKDIQEDIKINGYSNELIQCLINIFNNAKDALIENDNKLIFLTTLIDKESVIIKIKDNAGGIDETILQKVFEPYFTTKHQSKGTGLGLSITHKLIVEGMNGTIKAQNTEYQYNDKSYVGAEFIITLPTK